MPTDILLPSSGTLQSTGWLIPEGLTYSQWSDAGQILNRVDSARQWWIGDWWNGGVEWGKGREACEANGLNYETTKRCGAVSTAYQMCRRQHNLTFTHHTEAMAVKTDTLRDKFLDWCLYDEHGNDLPRTRSCADLRKAIAAYLDDQGWTDEQRERKTALENGENVLLNMTNDSTGNPVDYKLIQWAQFNGKLQRVDRGSIWGNPFELDKDGDRDTVCDNYDVYLSLKPSLTNRLSELNGKALACWCYPKRCHGESLCQR